MYKKLQQLKLEKKSIKTILFYSWKLYIADCKRLKYLPIQKISDKNIKYIKTPEKKTLYTKKSKLVLIHKIQLQAMLLI